ncbi:MAG: hypothetical protein EBT34_15590, partial [Acetobacteraceae bacterium]|nr:hypothetical protein [Acetobacteraceae bacterium]
MSGHTDIRAGGWVARLPQGWRPYALLMRLDRPIGSWLLFLPGLWAFALVAPDWRQGLWLTALFGLGAVLMRGAGCVVNDLWDRDLDRKVERTAGRPLASGALRARHALVFLALVLAAALLILLQLNGAAQMLGVASLVPVVLYPLAKRVTDWPQAVLGVIFSWAAPMGYVAVLGGLDGAALALWASGVTHRPPWPRSSPCGATPVGAAARSATRRRPPASAVWRTGRRSIWTSPRAWEVRRLAPSSARSWRAPACLAR